ANRCRARGSGSATGSAQVCPAAALVGEAVAGRGALTVPGVHRGGVPITFTLYKDASCTQTEGVSGTGAIAGGTSASYSTTHTFAAERKNNWQNSCHSET